MPLKLTTIINRKGMEDHLSKIRKSVKSISSRVIRSLSLLECGGKKRKKKKFGLELQRIGGLIL